MAVASSGLDGSEERAGHVVGDAPDVDRRHRETRYLTPAARRVERGDGRRYSTQLGSRGVDGESGERLIRTISENGEPDDGVDIVADGAGIP